MAESNASGLKVGLSFGFSKKIDTKKLQKSVASEELASGVRKKDFVLSLEDKEVKSTKPKEGPQKYVIPLINENNWRTIPPKPESGDVDMKTIDIDEIAVEEFLKDVNKLNEDWGRGEDTVDPNLKVPLLKNKIPAGYETDDKLDVSLRPDAPDAVDYDEIPIDHFGKAMLRGMGWEEGKGIGKNKKDVVPYEAIMRPKGLGLGADKNQSAENGDQKKTQVSEEADLEMKKGAYCLFLKGPKKDLYGIVQGLDEDNARVMVKLTVSGNMETSSQYLIKLVSKTEYEKYSKYINKGKVDKYKQDKTEKKITESSDSDDSSSDGSRSMSPSPKRSKKNSPSRSRSPSVKKSKSRSNSGSSDINRSTDKKRSLSRKKSVSRSRSTSKKRSSSRKKSPSKSRSKSSSKEQRFSKKKSISKGRSRSVSKNKSSRKSKSASRSRSRSPRKKSKLRRKSRSRSVSRKRSRSASKKRSRKRSRRSQSRSGSDSRSRSSSRSHSRSRSRKRSRSDSRKRSRGQRLKSRSYSRSRSRSRSRDRYRQNYRPFYNNYHRPNYYHYNNYRNYNRQPFYDNRRRYDNYNRNYDYKRYDDRKYEDRKHEDYKRIEKSERKKSPTEKDAKLKICGGIWVRANMKVRIIDKELFDGEHFKEKVVVDDVLEKDKIICKTTEGKLLENVPEAALETVIPKTSPSYVIILFGKHKGLIGEIIKRDKEKGSAMLELLKDRGTCVNIEYDSICEYVGEIDSDFYF